MKGKQVFNSSVSTVTCMGMQMHMWCCFLMPYRWQEGARWHPACVLGCWVSCAGSGSPLPPFQMTSSPWGPWMLWTEQLFSLRVPCQRWSLPPSVPTEDLATSIAAGTRSCPSCCGGVQGSSHIFLVTPNVSTVPDLLVWLQATERYQTHLTLCFRIIPRSLL